MSNRSTAEWRDPLTPLTRDERAKELTTFSAHIIGRLWDAKHSGRERGDRSRADLEADILSVEYPDAQS